MRLVVLLLALAAGKTDPKLVGTWLLAGQPFLTLNANGSGVMEDGKVRWSVEGTQLVIADDEEGTDKVQYALAGDTLTLSMGGVARARASRCRRPASCRRRWKGRRAPTPTPRRSPTRSGTFSSNRVAPRRRRRPPRAVRSPPRQRERLATTN
jgi:hypothetical protein